MTDEDITTARALIQAAQSNRDRWSYEELSRYCDHTLFSPGNWADALDEIQRLRAMFGVAA